MNFAEVWKISYKNLVSWFNKYRIDKGSRSIILKIKYGENISEKTPLISNLMNSYELTVKFNNITTKTAYQICKSLDRNRNFYSTSLSIQELFEQKINESISLYISDGFDENIENISDNEYILKFIRANDNLAFIDNIYQVRNGKIIKNGDGNYILEDNDINELHEEIKRKYQYSLWINCQANNNVIKWENKQYLLMNIDTDVHEYFNDEQKGKIERPLNINYEANNKTVQYENIVGNNLIFYGAPGTGKSYGIQKYIQDDLGFKEIDVKVSDNVFRTTFHPEYGYSDFVGQIMPAVNEKGQLEYIFNPGSFTQALVYAYIHSDEPVFLILEEMSRANCASVFGDIFQLLDRDEKGESEYPINHLQLSNYLHKKLGESHSWNKYQSKIYIPRNLYLISTMNTSDQNVFVMDTAFKRRFLMKYVPTTIDSSKNQFSLPYSDTETMEWNDFVKTVNDYIVDDKGLQLSEDKQLGQFFMKGKNQKRNDDSIQEESTPYFAKNFETYKDKVLYYLYHDVEKASYHTEKCLFNENIKSFGDLYQKATAKNHYDIYSKEFKECLEENIHPTKDVSYNMDDEIEENE